MMPGYLPLLSAPRQWIQTTASSVMVLLLLAAASITTRAQTITSPSSCASIIQAGVYNTLSTTSSAASAQDIYSSLCTDYSTYTYDAYKLDRASIDSSSSGSSSSNYDSYCNSRAYKIEASAKFLKVSGSGSFSDSQSSCKTTSNSEAKFGSALTADQFSTARTQAAAYRASGCSISSSSTFSNAALQTLSQTIEPAVLQAYQSCLSAYKAGVRYKTQYTLNQRSATLMMIYVPQEGVTQKGRIMGVFISTTYATCTLTTPNSNTVTTSAFKVDILPNLNYFFFCTLKPNTPADGQTTEVHITTNPGDIFQLVLYHSPPQNSLAQLREQVVEQQAALTRLQAQVDTLTRGTAKKLCFNGGVCLVADATGRLHVQNAAGTKRAATFSFNTADRSQLLAYGSGNMTQALALKPTEVCFHTNYCIGLDPGDANLIAFRNVPAGLTVAHFLMVPASQENFPMRWDIVKFYVKQNGGVPYWYLNRDSHNGVWTIG